MTPKTDREWEELHESERLRVNSIAPWSNDLDICPFCHKPIALEEIRTQAGLVWGSECCFVTLEILGNLDVFRGLPGNLQQIELKRVRDELTYLVRMNKKAAEEYDHEAAAALNRDMERLGLLKH